MPLKAGNTFFMSSTGGLANPAGGHLFVCLTDEDDKGNIITAAITTYRPGYDKSCLLDIGDHPFLKHPSCMAYDKANKMSEKRLSELIANNTYKMDKDVSPGVLSRIRKGLLNSDDAPEYLKKDYKAALVFAIKKAKEEKAKEEKE